MPADNRPYGQTAVDPVKVSQITQQETYDTGPDGRPVLGYRISFTTPSGTRASVFVPGPQYTPENASSAIQQKATAIEAVHRLGA